MYLYFVYFMLLKSIGLIINFSLTTSSKKCYFNFLNLDQLVKFISDSIRRNIYLQNSLNLKV